MCFAEDEKFDFWSCGFKGSSKCPQPHHQPSHCNPLHLFFMSDFFQSLKHEMRCIVASVFVVFPAQLEAGGTQNSEMGGKKGSGEILSSCQTHQTRDARRALLWVQHPRASTPPSFSGCLLFAHPKTSSHSQITFRTLHKA